MFPSSAGGWGPSAQHAHPAVGAEHDSPHPTFRVALARSRSGWQTPWRPSRPAGANPDRAKAADRACVTGRSRVSRCLDTTLGDRAIPGPLARNSQVSCTERAMLVHCARDRRGAHVSDCLYCQLRLRFARSCPDRLPWGAHTLYGRRHAPGQARHNRSQAAGAAASPRAALPASSASRDPPGRDFRSSSILFKLRSACRQGGTGERTVQGLTRVVGRVTQRIPLALRQEGR
jgi:hypothetical protein